MDVYGMGAWPKTEMDKNCIQLIFQNICHLNFSP